MARTMDKTGVYHEDVFTGGRQKQANAKNYQTGNRPESNIECQGQTTKAVHMEGISKLFEVVGHRVLANVDESSLNGWIFTQMNKQIPSLMAKDNMECLVIPDAHLDTKNTTVRLALVVIRIG
ncbi:hypothetical protein HZS61_005203 [Fusarium oxysporum f. sp. conglutinans]|uniref:Uncharacterized protein n=1 Tax=Fusarium oxysporum f. sp. conglutinans TaxID=100902 RepID=A0A8H6LCI8_FUSOX|nr:hypothetical protein HZS61_005203 [Fusarium oxysporum f. sp. conglutinans]